MKTIQLITIFTVLILFTACNPLTVSGGTPNGVRFASTAYVLKSYLNVSRLSDANFLYDKSGNRYVKFEADADGNGVNDIYQDAAGTTKTVVMEYNAAYDLIHHPEHYTPLTNGAGMTCYKVTVDSYSSFEFTNVDPTSPGASNQTVTGRYAVSITPE